MLCKFGAARGPLLRRRHPRDRRGRQRAAAIAAAIATATVATAALPAAVAAAAVTASAIAPTVAATVATSVAAAGPLLPELRAVVQPTGLGVQPDLRCVRQLVARDGRLPA